MAQPDGDRYVIGGDLGGTRYRVALADAAGQIVRRLSTLTLAEEGRDAVVARMKGKTSEVMAGIGRGQVTAIAIAAPGPLDPWTGTIYRPPNLPGWDEVPLKRIFEDEFGIPVQVGNDANLAALAELRFGAGRGCSHMVYITVSTGVGGGVIDRGELMLGAGGGAGEIGHMTIDMAGPLCNCGNRGCLEALASGTAVARQAIRLLRSGARSSLADLVDGELEQITAEVVVQAARAGDEIASQVMSQAGYALGVGVANLMHLYDPQAIIIGGGVTNAGPLLFDPMRRAIEERAMASFRKRTRVVQAELGDDVVVLGAVALALSGSSRG